MALSGKAGVSAWAGDGGAAHAEEAQGLRGRLLPQERSPAVHARRVGRRVATLCAVSRREHSGAAQLRAGRLGGCRGRLNPWHGRAARVDDSDKVGRAAVATRQLQPSPECDAVHSKTQHAKPQERFFPKHKQHRCTIFSLAGSRARERRACAADVSRLASDLQGAAGLNRCIAVVWHVGFTWQHVWSAVSNSRTGSVK